MVSFRHRVLAPLTALVIGLGVTVTFAAESAQAATFTVTNTNDAGAGSLRQAITDANAAAGADTINFGGSVSGTITLASALPTINSDITISGPGESTLTISGADSYKVFNVNGGTLTISGLTLTHGQGANGGLIYVANSTVSATHVTFTNQGSGTAVWNNNGGAVSTYTSCTFSNNGVGIGGDYGSTPSSVSNTDADYSNRTYVINSTFNNNTYAINQQRFTKITGSTFTNNVIAAGIYGLNRTSILNSTFSGNSTAIDQSDWTPTTWTSVGSNNRYYNNNTFSNNGTTISLQDYWNDGHASQQWATITNNTWDGAGTWISGAKWNGSSNITDSVTTVNSGGHEWTESGNILNLPTTTTTSTTTTTTTTTTTVPVTTTAPATTTTVAGTTTTTMVSQSQIPLITTTTTIKGTTTTTSSVPKVSKTGAATTTTVAPTTTTSTIPAPNAPSVGKGQAGATSDGTNVVTSITRVNNVLQISAGSIGANVYAVSSKGAHRALDSEGNVRFETGDSLQVEASGFGAGQHVQVWLHSAPVLLGTLTADSAGKASKLMAVPAGVKAGVHNLILNGVDSAGHADVVSVAVIAGAAQKTSMTTRLLIIIPVTLAAFFALIIPATRRRRRVSDGV